MVRVWFDEISWVESLREYVKIRLVNGQSVVTKIPLGTLEKMLEGQGLLRIHRSFLVATRHIEAYTAIEVMVQGESLPVGRLYRDQAFFESE